MSVLAPTLDRSVAYHSPEAKIARAEKRLADEQQSSDKIITHLHGRLRQVRTEADIYLDAIQQLVRLSDHRVDAIVGAAMLKVGRASEGAQS